MSWYVMGNDGLGISRWLFMVRDVRAASRPELSPAREFDEITADHVELGLYFHAQWIEPTSWRNEILLVSQKEIVKHKA
jgi:hypothetical protein